MARLPQPGGDAGDWGNILNDFLDVAHNPDGTLNTQAVSNSGAIIGSNNLSDLQSPALARTNLGLGTAATKNVGSTSGTVAAGDDSRITGAVQEGTVTTKGDILAASGNAAVTRLGVGGDGQVLTADSTQTTGVKWAPAPSAPVTSVFGRTGAVTAQSGDYTASQVGALPATDDLSAIASANTTAGNISMNSHKITNLSNGTAATDAATFGQIPTTLPPNGSAGGDLSGTYPNPTVAKVNGITVSGTPSNGQVLTATSSMAASWQALSADNDTLASDADVAISSPASNQVLTYNSSTSKWVNQAPPVSSVFGRTGEVTAQSGDYTYSQVGAAQGLTPTSVKTGAYTASPGDFVPVDASGVSVTITLPTAPADKTRLGIKLITAPGSNIATVAASGSDVFNKTGGSTTLSLSAQFQGVLLQYAASSGIWYVSTADTPLNVASGAAKLGTDGTIGGPGGSSLSSAIVRSSVTSVGPMGVINVKSAPYNATGNGSTDDTSAIQAAINAANTAGAVVYFPAGQYRVSQLTLLSGTILQGVSSGTYPTNNTISGVSVLERIASTNLDLLLVPDGNNYGRIFDLAIDGNKNNNTAGYGLKIADGASGQESQWIVERCYFHDNPYSNVYLGANRRCNKIMKGVFNYSGSGDGITVAGSDNTIEKNIIGSNARAGVCLGTTATQNWAASSSPNAAAVAHVTNNDIYGNQVGVAIASSSSDCIVAFNGVDRHGLQGITVYDGSSNAIIGNSFHSNGTATNNTYAHIDVASGVTAVNIISNNFGPLDSGITNVASYAVSVAGSSNQVLGNMGTLDSTSTVGGLTNSSSNTPAWVTLSNAGARIKGSGNDIMDLYTSSGSLVFKMTGAGTPVYSGGGVQYTVNSGHVFGSSSALSNTLVSFINSNAANTILQTKNTSGQTANIATFLQSDGSTVLAQIDKSGLITTPALVAAGLTGAASASRYVGATSSGAPTSGTFSIGDYVIDQTGKIWVCTTAGTPGTWTATNSNLVAPVSVPTGSDTNKGIVIKANSATQSANLQEWQDSTSSALYVIDQNGVLSSTRTGTGSAAYRAAVRGDAQARLQIDNTGQIEVGDGTNARDTFLTRASAGVYNVNAALSVTGLTGATSASRYVGATSSGAPASGTFAIGDWVIDQTGKIWICTTAGTPGTWTQIGGGGVTSYNSRTGAVVPASGDYTAAQVTNAADKSSASTQTFTGNISAPVHIASGLTGATAASRYVGATTSGAPTSGTFAVGDFVIDQTGLVWVCTTAGSPGTWLNLSPLNPAQQLFGYLGWTFDPAMISGGTALAGAGVMTLAKIPWAYTQTVTNIVAACSAGGSGLTSGQCFAGIYSSSGSLLGATADQSTTWNASGTKTMAISGGPISVPGGGTSGFIYVAFLWNGTTSPSFFKAANSATAASANMGLAASAYRSASNSSSNTSLPSALTLSSSTALANTYWTAVS